MSADRVLLVIVGVVAALLQLLLSPALTFGDATPGFIVVAVVSIIILFPDERHYVFAFVMGLVADLIGQSPVGATSFCLLGCSFLLPMAVEAVGNDNLLMSFLLIFAGTVGVELVFCVFLSLAGILGFIDGIAHVALPCGIYNAILGFIVYILAFNIARSRGDRSGVTMSNVRFQ
jgi:rod shape-determining protein MreD